jgi:hypothetical protein
LGYSGAGLYDDDTGADVRGRFRELVADGIATEAATDSLVSEWEDVLEYPEVRCAFWLALADTQSRLGRLEDRVRDRALELIRSGEDLARFDHDIRLSKGRGKVLEALATRLTSAQRKPVTPRPPFRSLSPVAVGDVFWYIVPSGRRILLRCVAISGDARDNYPTVEVLDWSAETPPADLAAVVARPGRPRANDHWPDLLALVRYPGDPDPGMRIEIVGHGVPLKRRRTLPALMLPWTTLEEDVARVFGNDV